MMLSKVVGINYNNPIVTSDILYVNSNVHSAVIRARPRVTAEYGVNSLSRLAYCCLQIKPVLFNV
jgi:hypothetical protein